MRKYTEPVCWLTALLALFLTDFSDETFSFCLFKFVGFTTCPGCGIGRAIHYALQFKFQQSFQSHWFGIPATFILLYHIATSFYHICKKQKNGPTTTAYDAARPAAR